MTERNSGMADNTDPKLKNQVIYSVYVRNHTSEGTFRALTDDLERIRSLGTDIIWLMPVHPIGTKDKKGSLGCPYAIRDYRDVNPFYGTLEDFRNLCDQIHRHGMKVMIDVVYNHTSPDSVLWNTHPEFFYKKPDGCPGNRVGEWSDVIDLDYGVPELWDYQIETLVQWAHLVDGFRCDVASFVPVEFWKRARAAVEKVRPGCIWLAETVHREFGNAVRAKGMYSARDTEAFEAFDIEYDYDIRTAFEAYLTGKMPLAHWTDLLNFQEAIYPANYNKLRFLENHDTARIASFVKDERDLKNFTAMLYFLKGTALLYAGQEWENDHTPSLFEKETICRSTGKDISAFLAALGHIRHEDLDADDAFFAEAQCNDIAVMKRVSDTVKYGIFSLHSEAGKVHVDVPDGSYTNLLDGKEVFVRSGEIRTEGDPIIFTPGLPL